MIEKVNPSHPDKLADRIAGAIVDLAYQGNSNPRIAVEVLLGHDSCYIIIESDVFSKNNDIQTTQIINIVDRIAGIYDVHVDFYDQDYNLSINQGWGDNGIFKAEPLTKEEELLSKIARRIYEYYPEDGKYILDGDKLIVCQSNCNDNKTIEDIISVFPQINWLKINPLGPWIGGPDVDSGATNRKLGSDMGHSITGGGLHGKDLSKADVSVNIYAWLKAKETGQKVELSCAIGDDYIDGKSKVEIMQIARDYIHNIGGFEKFAEWGLF